MRIICPRCLQDHEVPNDRLRSTDDSATMQCARCQQVFPLASQPSVKPPKRRVSHNRLLAGILLAIVVALVFTLLAIVALKNDGVLALDKLPEQVKIALDEESEVASGKDLERLQISLREGYKLVIRDKNPILVIKGEVFNPGPSRRTRILLEGQIVDDDGKVQFETRSPCGKMFANRRLKRTPRGRFSKLFVRKKEYFNCELAPGKKKRFQMIFDDIPPDYSDDYTVKVRTLFSGHESEE